MATDGNYTDHGNHFVMHRNSESVCCRSVTISVLDQFNFNKTSKNVDTSNYFCNVSDSDLLNFRTEFQFYI